jgi:hypothetical protein
MTRQTNGRANRHGTKDLGQIVLVLQGGGV